MKTLDKNKPILFLGDHHGVWSNIFCEVDEKDIKNCYLVSVGDSGIGFNYKEKESFQNKCHNEEFKDRDIIFMAIRGNHDDPAYFRGSERIVLSNFELIEDYTVMQYSDKTIQFIGGATSIDRTARKEGKSYWKGEVLNFYKNKCKEVDVLVTHTAPTWCFPQQFNEMVYGWAREDTNLIGDLSNERAIMNEICKLCKPKLHLYGHFHDSWTENINGCEHRLLDINEIWENRKYF